MPPVRPSRGTSRRIDYLARDFNSLRQLLLDRLAMIAPDWTDRNVADLGVTLIELLAYVGDQLSYRQDAVATEAYLGTARRRISARRHTRLVDYRMHDGCNARAWLQVRVADDVVGAVVLPKGTQVLTAVVNQPPLIAPDSSAYDAAIGSGAEVFETMTDAELYAAHDELRFYTWGALQSCLPRGAMRATLRGSLPQLKAGDFLLLREVVSPRSGDPDDADFAHRHVVRLVEVTPRVDPVGSEFDDPPENQSLDVTDIEWAPEDALPFPLCISAEADDEFGGGYIQDVSMAFGNLVLADHGQQLRGEELGAVPAPTVGRLPADQVSDENSEDEDDSGPQLVLAPVRFTPSLKNGPLTEAVPLADANDPLPSATALMAFDPHEALPAITLATKGSVPELWHPEPDLLNSGVETRAFVVEVEDDGTPTLRFGDGEHGAAVVKGMAFMADYRVGNGARGNVGAETLVHLISADSRIERVTNPLPASGGVEPETIEQARQQAPFTFREQQLRAVTPADYAARAASFGGVQRAAGTLRWTGSWHTMFVSVDRLSGLSIDPDFESRLRAKLEPYRMAGLDLEINPPQPVALDLVLRVRVQPGYFRSDIDLALREIFTSGVRSDGLLGLFHPDNFSFAQTVYLSPWVAAAQSVDGVEAIEVVTFQRRDDPGGSAKDDGFITVGRLEVPVLENNPNFPERGTFDLIMEGGK